MLRRMVLHLLELQHVGCQLVHITQRRDFASEQRLYTATFAREQYIESRHWLRELQHGPRVDCILVLRLGRASVSRQVSLLSQLGANNHRDGSNHSRKVRREKTSLGMTRRCAKPPLAILLSDANHVARLQMQIKDVG